MILDIVLLIVSTFAFLVWLAALIVQIKEINHLKEKIAMLQMDNIQLRVENINLKETIVSNTNKGDKE